jgi:hypothetical protein
MLSPLGSAVMSFARRCVETKFYMDVMRKVVVEKAQIAGVLMTLIVGVSSVASCYLRLPPLIR